MPDGWKPLKDGEIVIAHVSDLHFGSRNVDESWGLVQQQLRVIKPELILVTGDLVDTPERGDYQRAREKLDSLGINYYVCMGNHDRFPRGNRLAFQQWLGSWWYRGCVVCAVLFVAGLLLWFLCQWWLWILTAVALLLAGLLWLLPWMLTHLWSDEAAGWFNHVFDGKVLGPDRAIEVNIGPDSVPWQLGLVGADSNSRADAWARGFIPEEQFQTLADTTQGKQWDLCIILVHHHLLPIRELEGKWQQDPLRWANLSCLVNAGRFLEALTEAQVDLVLHGHEHAANWASYGSLIQGRGTVRVVAAGSATGNRSVQGCQADQATFNVLVLGADRSVRLRCLSRKQGDWNVEELPLFDPATVRHGRMRRARTSLKRRGEINSEITKYVEFTRERDVWVYWRYTHWRLPKDEFVQKIRNSTGEPDQAEVRVYGYEPNATTFKPEVQVERHKEVHAWVIRWTVPTELVDKEAIVEMAYRWHAGALLTAEEMREVDDRRSLDPLRRQGWEFLVTRAGGAVASITMIVTLPQEYGPEEGGGPDVRVGGGQSYAAEVDQLRQYLSVFAPGRFALRIAYPHPDRDYQLVWKPAPEVKVGERMTNTVYEKRFAAKARSQGSELLQAFCEAFTSSALWGNATLSLYVKAQGEPHLERVAYMAVGPEPIADDPKPQVEVPLIGDRHALGRAWYGESVIAKRPETSQQAVELGFLPAEKALLCVPVRFSLSNINPPAWGIVRVAIVKNVDESLLHSDNTAKLMQLLSLATAKLLTAALQQP